MARPPAEAIGELRAINAEARQVGDQLQAGGAADADEAYRRLQSRAAALNGRYQWAPAEEFAVMVPTLEVRDEIETLNARYDAARSGEQASTRSTEDLLVNLWGWIEGVLLAYDNLPE